MADNAATLGAAQPPGKPLRGVILPRNWERAYGYAGYARFIAAWWDPNGPWPSEAMVSDGRCHAAVEGWPYFIDLTGLLIRGGYAHERLTFHADPPTHCALLDLTARTVYHSPLTAALMWLREHADLAIDEISPAEAAHPRTDDSNGSDRGLLQTDRDHLCRVCGGYGWCRSSVDGQAMPSYDLCAACEGRGVVFLMDEDKEAHVASRVRLGTQGNTPRQTSRKGVA